MGQRTDPNLWKPNPEWTSYLDIPGFERLNLEMPGYRDSISTDVCVRASIADCFIGYDHVGGTAHTQTNQPLNQPLRMAEHRQLVAAQ